MANVDPLPEPIFETETRIPRLVEERKYVPRDEGRYYAPGERRWYAASKLGACIRANYYRFVKRLPEPEDPHFITTRAPVGKAWEDIITTWFENAKLVRSKQRSVSDPELFLKGIIDLEIEDEGAIVPVEIKSLDNADAWRSRPKPEAYLQLQAYLLMTKAHHGYLAYASTENVADWWMWRSETDLTAQNWIRARLRDLELYRMLGYPPPRPVDDPAKFRQCSWCPFRKPCWEAKE